MPLGNERERHQSDNSAEMEYENTAWYKFPTTKHWKHVFPENQSENISWPDGPVNLTGPLIFSQASA